MRRTSVFVTGAAAEMGDVGTVFLSSDRLMSLRTLIHDLKSISRSAGMAMLRQRGSIVQSSDVEEWHGTVSRHQIGCS